MSGCGASAAMSSFTHHAHLLQPFGLALAHRLLGVPLRLAVCLHAMEGALPPNAEVGDAGLAPETHGVDPEGRR